MMLPRELIHDRDRICGAIVTRRLRAMGIRCGSALARDPMLERNATKRLKGKVQMNDAYLGGERPGRLRRDQNYPHAISPSEIS